MKLALITDWRGFPLLDELRLSYHLVLAQYVLSDVKYADTYVYKHRRGDFIIMDNGAAEDGTVSLADLQKAAEKIRPDEIILPDVMCDAVKTVEASFNEEVLAFIPPRQRAVCPQGNDLVEWLACANQFASEMEFATMCVPKHLERFVGGRVKALDAIRKLGWHNSYNIHLLGIWGDPATEVEELRKAAPWARGLDTAAPLALAQHNKLLEPNAGHVSHAWNRPFTRNLALHNIKALMDIMERE